MKRSTLESDPRLTTLFAESGIEPLEVQPFPVSTSRLGRPDGPTWQARRASIEQQMSTVDDERVREAGMRYLEALSRYETETASPPARASSSCRAPSSSPSSVNGPTRRSP